MEFLHCHEKYVAKLNTAHQRPILGFAVPHQKNPEEKENQSHNISDVNWPDQGHPSLRPYCLLQSAPQTLVPQFFGEKTRESRGTPFLAAAHAASANNRLLRFCLLSANSSQRAQPRFLTHLLKFIKEVNLSTWFGGIIYLTKFKL